MGGEEMQDPTIVVEEPLFTEWADQFYIGKVYNIDGQDYKVKKIKKLRKEVVLKLIE